VIDVPVAVLVCRAGQPPLGGDEAVAEVGGHAVVAGQGAREAAGQLTAAYRVWTLETPPGLQVGRLAGRLAPLLAASPLVVLPGSADGRDLAPRLAIALDRPLLAATTGVGLVDAPVGEVAEVLATLTRLDDRLAVPVRVPAPVVATLPPGVRSVVPAASTEVIELPPTDDDREGAGHRVDVEVIEVLEPDAATMDLAEAPRVVGGGAGLVPPGAGDDAGRAVFELLRQVGAALGASTGATRVITDAGWMGFDRQIGTTGVTLAPDLYLALGISGAVQHVGGIGNPDHVVSVNTDPSCPMTAMATLGLVTDARALLAELAHRFGIDVPAVAGLPTPSAATGQEVPA
jgi:electron transfer flavoprotein alpha subunit